MRVLNAVEAAAAEDLLESDMRFLTEDVGPRHDVSLVFVPFRVWPDASLRWDRRHEGAGAGLQARGDMADSLSCWDASRLQLERENQSRAESESTRHSRLPVLWKFEACSKQSNALART
jgi:hypothetical protein